MNRSYKVVFTGLLRTKAFFKNRISMLGVSPETAEEILKKAPVVLKEADSIGYINKYATAITNAGGRVNVYSIDSTGSSGDGFSTIPGMSSFTQCPQCGYKQAKKKLCVRCGQILIRPVKE